ncbi:MAG: hypothetical protein LBU32_30730 [Clostridiales bacterium]|nr:hypothetical protein [Clostridiales bacterium]
MPAGFAAFTSSGSEALAPSRPPFPGLPPFAVEGQAGLLAFSENRPQGNGYFAETASMASSARLR